mmetsp:Transcript_17074/g.31911  ORF Transcript_17074/g.31911 Transcript_17074/m.31911 type:complete len:90 (+) Transcript_17074:80-349(+)
MRQRDFLLSGWDSRDTLVTLCGTDDRIAVTSYTGNGIATSACADSGLLLPWVKEKAEKPIHTERSIAIRNSFSQAFERFATLSRKRSIP